MKYDAFLAAEASLPKPAPGGGAARKSVFKLFFAAVYYSRRVQAERTLRGYQRRIDEAQRNILRVLSVRYGARDRVDQ